MGGGAGGLYRKIIFGLVFRALENPLIPIFIEIQWKQKNREPTPKPPPKWGLGGSHGQIFFDFVFKPLENPQVPSFIEIR